MWSFILLLIVAAVIVFLVAKRSANGNKTHKADYSDFFTENEKKN